MELPATNRFEMGVWPRLLPSSETSAQGRAFTLIMGSNFAVLGIGMVAAGVLVNEVGPRWVWGIAGGLAAAAALTGHAMLRRTQKAVAEPARI